MAGVKKQVKGTTRKAVGEAKRVTGKATNNRSLQAKGAAEKGKGKAKTAAGRTAQKARGVT